MPYGVRTGRIQRAMHPKHRPKNSISTEVVRDQVKRALKQFSRPITINPKGAMKPKLNAFITKPVRMTKLTFQGSWNGLCSATNISVPYVFRMNSIHDPDFSNFTRNVVANGWTACNNLYVDYRVHACKVKITFRNNSEHPCYIILSANNDTSIQPSTTYPADILARPGSFAKICGRYGSKQDTVSVSKKYQLHEVEGISKKEFNDSSSTASLMNASPTDACFCYATISSLPEAGGNASFGVFTIHMTFDVELLNPKEPYATQP